MKNNNESNSEDTVNSWFEKRQKTMRDNFWDPVQSFKFLKAVQSLYPPEIIRQYSVEDVMIEKGNIVVHLVKRMNTLNDQQLEKELDIKRLQQ